MEPPFPVPPRPTVRDLLDHNKDEKSTVPLKKMLEFHDVFFFTPQILINNIEKGETRLTDFTLLILDECHHTAKGEPYNNLMRKYIKSKYRNIFRGSEDFHFFKHFYTALYLGSLCIFITETVNKFLDALAFCFLRFIFY